MSKNKLSQLREQVARSQMSPRPKPVLSTLGQGGPVDRHNMLRSQLMQTDPKRFRDFVQRGFDSYDVAQPTSSGEAEMLMDADNPAVQMPGYVVRSAPPQAYDPQAELQRELFMRSLSSPRGWAQAKTNEANDAALRAQLEHLRDSAMPADRGDGDFSTNRRMLDILLSLTGQAGGMR